VGDLLGARKEFEYVARRKAGSVDARAALAALYYHEGRLELAEDEWEGACTQISVGCGKYKSKEWLETVRRWPPVMVGLLLEFLTLQKGETPKEVQKDEPPKDVPKDGASNDVPPKGEGVAGAA
jgi:hypothetical protein